VSACVCFVVQADDTVVCETMALMSRSGQDDLRPANRVGVKTQNAMSFARELCTSVLDISVTDNET
jgi:hypothetical protein